MPPVFGKEMRRRVFYGVSFRDAVFRGGPGLRRRLLFETPFFVAYTPKEEGRLGNHGHLMARDMFIPVFASVK
jgi:hypothetical protein